MTPRNIQLATDYFETIMGKPLDALRPVQLSGWQVVDILWPLNEVFRSVIHRIRTIKYDKRFESDADQAIETFVRSGDVGVWQDLPGETWRVLLERHAQIVTVALANEMQHNSVTVLPEGLPVHAQLCGIMLLLLHSMTLPFPIEDRSLYELPEGGPPSSLKLH